MHRVEHVMGFPVSLRVDDVTDPSVSEGAADAVFAWLREVDERFSPYREDSEVSRLDRGELSADRLSDDLTEVLGLCEEYRIATGGAFDVRLPGRGLDPCAVVKGWSVQRAANLLDAAGLTRFCLNAGGDVVVSGGPWRVGVRHPFVADKVCASSPSPTRRSPPPRATSAATTSSTGAPVCRPSASTASPSSPRT